MKKQIVLSVIITAVITGAFVFAVFALLGRVENSIKPEIYLGIENRHNS